LPSKCKTLSSNPSPARKRKMSMRKLGVGLKLRIV
jgi:hypothetical protein